MVVDSHLPQFAFVNLALLLPKCGISDLSEQRQNIARCNDGILELSSLQPFGKRYG